MRTDDELIGAAFNVYAELLRTQAGSRRLSGEASAPLRRDLRAEANRLAHLGPALRLRWADR